MRGGADAESTRIYAEAYNRDADFYAFLKSLETYEQTADPSTIMILTTDSELLRFLKAKAVEETCRERQRESRRATPFPARGRPEFLNGSRRRERGARDDGACA